MTPPGYWASDGNWYPATPDPPPPRSYRALWIGLAVLGVVIIAVLTTIVVVRPSSKKTIALETPTTRSTVVLPALAIPTTVAELPVPTVIATTAPATTSTTKPPVTSPTTAPAVASSPTPAAPPAAPVAPIRLSGTGSRITSRMSLPTGGYTLAWAATGGAGQGYDTFSITPYTATGQRQNTLVNVILPNPSSGRLSVFAAGGDFYLSIQAVNITWTITITAGG